MAKNHKEETIYGSTKSPQEDNGGIRSQRRNNGHIETQRKDIDGK